MQTQNNSMQQCDEFKKIFHTKLICEYIALLQSLMKVLK